MPSKKPLLYFDIETSIMCAYTHALGQQYVSYKNLKKGYDCKKVLCLSYKEPGWKKAKSLVWDHKKKCDKKLLKDFNKIASQYDLLLAHNGQGFDIKELRTAIALRGIPVAWCETHCLDTLKDWRRTFRMPSNRLDAVAQMLGVGRKNPINITHWIDATEGCKKALTQMDMYCRMDTEIMQACHERLEPWVKPSLACLNRKKMDYADYPKKCSNEECGNKDKNLFIKFGFYSYKAISCQKYLCKVCDKVNMPDKDKAVAAKHKRKKK